MGGRLWAQAALVMLGMVPALASFASVMPKGYEGVITNGARIFNTDSFGSHLRPVLDADALFQASGATGVGVKSASRFMTCATCHINGGETRGLLADGNRMASLRNAAAVFPRYSKKAHQVVTLASQIQRCVRVGILGHPPAAGSRTMVDLVSYLTWIARGQRMNIGGTTH
ncbi:MAG TPA: hypothetical protein VMV40_03925 [Acidiferrobacter sp.]|nr:hypothetical protein [Acidiferrobacter sp.]